MIIFITFIEPYVCEPLGPYFSLVNYSIDLIMLISQRY